MIVPSSGLFHRVYKSLLQDSYFYLPSYAKRVPDICAKLEIGIRRKKLWAIYGVYLHYTQTL
jgi:hypothetical protein